MADKKREHMIASIEKAMPYAEDGTIQFSVKVVKILLEMLKEQPEIVHCKNCKHGCDWDDGRWKCIKNGGMHVPYWFCADGERG